MFNKGQKKVTTTKWEQNLLWKLAIDKSPGRHANESGKNMKLALRQDSSDQGRNPCITYKTSSSVKTSVLSQRQLCNLFPLLSIGLLIKHYKPLFWYANRPFWQSNQFTIDNMSHITCFFFFLLNILFPSEICHITEVKISRKRFMLTFKSNKRLALRQFTCFYYPELLFPEGPANTLRGSSFMCSKNRLEVNCEWLNSEYTALK